MKWTDLDEFTVSFLETALWTTSCLNGGSLGNYLDIADLSEETLRQAAKDCASFQKEAGEFLDRSDRDNAQHGHDFFLTREGHGAGFWDGDYPKDGDKLTEMSRPYGEFDFDERYQNFSGADN